MQRPYTSFIHLITCLSLSLLATATVRGQSIVDSIHARPCLVCPYSGKAFYASDESTASTASAAAEIVDDPYGNLTYGYEPYQYDDYWYADYSQEADGVEVCEDASSRIAPEPVDPEFAATADTDNSAGRVCRQDAIEHSLLSRDTTDCRASSGCQTPASDETTAVGAGVAGADQPLYDLTTSYDAAYNAAMTAQPLVADASACETLASSDGAKQVRVAGNEPTTVNTCDLGQPAECVDGDWYGDYHDACWGGYCEFFYDDYRCGLADVQRSSEPEAPLPCEMDGVYADTYADRCYGLREDDDEPMPAVVPEVASAAAEVAAVASEKTEETVAAVEAEEAVSSDPVAAVDAGRSGGIFVYQFYECDGYLYYEYEGYDYEVCNDDAYAVGEAEFLTTGEDLASDPQDDSASDTVVTPAQDAGREAEAADEVPAAIIDDVEPTEVDPEVVRNNSQIVVPYEDVLPYWNDIDCFGAWPAVVSEPAASQLTLDLYEIAAGVVRTGRGVAQDMVRGALDVAVGCTASDGVSVAEIPEATQQR